MLGQGEVLELLEAGFLAREALVVGQEGRELELALSRIVQQHAAQGALEPGVLLGDHQGVEGQELRDQLLRGAVVDGLRDQVDQQLDDPGVEADGLRDLRGLTVELLPLLRHLLERQIDLGQDARELRNLFRQRAVDQARPVGFQGRVRVGPLLLQRLAAGRIEAGGDVAGAPAAFLLQLVDQAAGLGGGGGDRQHALELVDAAEVLDDAERGDEH